jgi:predicted GIY-YIG superfamily endonuclease
MDNPGKRIVYILRSDVDPSRHYVGVTRDFRNRLDWHNHGPCGFTTANRPWSLLVTSRANGMRAHSKST